MCVCVGARKCTLGKQRTEVLDNDWIWFQSYLQGKHGKAKNTLFEGAKYVQL